MMRKANLIWILALLYCVQVVVAQEKDLKKAYPFEQTMANSAIHPLKLALSTDPQSCEYIDLDQDGDPDVLKSMTTNHIPIQWIDDDDDMKLGDLMGDTDSDCIMADLNKDGQYGHYSDVVVDWVDNDGDGDADMEIYLEYANESQKDRPWGPGHLMINIDVDDDNIMNHIDWNTFKLRAWLHDGVADFYEDYQGKSLFLKIHASPEKLNDVRLNWENPFLFYDPDHDGLTEYAIRVIDKPDYGEPGETYITKLTGKASWISMTYDLDNDNAPGNEFDYDMTINFRGEGFDYTDQVHKYPAMRGLPESDAFFMDARVRQLTELIYPDHDAVRDLVFNRGNWNEVYFAYDEDDDCKRWERVELYDPKDPYIVGRGKGGLDNNAQSDVVGNRGEWDLDNSGKGNLYISRLDGKIHLYGAEYGYWRIDQSAYYYHGMGGLYDGYGPGRMSRDVQQPFPLVKYTDKDNNGFFDQIQYDLDGNKTYEVSVSLKEWGADDECKIIDMSQMDYSDLVQLKQKVANDMWDQAQQAIRVAKSAEVDLQWYELLMHPKSIRQKYHMGYWLQLYILKDLVQQASNQGDADLVEQYVKAFHTAGWETR